jgi:hypothetical protein
MMRALRVSLAVSALAWAGAAQAATFVIFVEPMTLEKHTRVFDTPGPDRLLMCVQPPSLTGCTELPLKTRR